MTRRERVSRNRQGSNQHQTKRKHRYWLWDSPYAWLFYFATFINFVVLSALSPLAPDHKEARAEGIVSPIPEEHAEPVQEDIGQIQRAQAPVTPTPTPTATDDPIEQEIREVFGEYADEAFLILSCENRGLRPDAVGTNTDGSQDHGIFQINDHWHGFKKTVNNARYLHDPSINIRIAWRIFEGSGYSWNLWSCARKVGLTR